jgi:hypothetical protein
VDNEKQTADNEQCHLLRLNPNVQKVCCTKVFSRKKLAVENFQVCKDSIVSVTVVMIVSVPLLWKFMLFRSYISVFIQLVLCTTSAPEKR